MLLGPAHIDRPTTFQANRTRRAHQLQMDITREANQGASHRAIYTSLQPDHILVPKRDPKLQAH